MITPRFRLSLVAAVVLLHGGTAVAVGQELHKLHVVALMGLETFRQHCPHQLSGGMQQLTAIARALAIDPEVLLMDEPFRGLDEFTVRDLRHQLLDIWTATRKTVLLVTHKSFATAFLADRIPLISRPPAHVFDEIRVALAQLRTYHGPEIFDVNRTVVKNFFAGIGEPAHA